MRTLDEDATVAERIRFYRMKRNMTGDILAKHVGLSRHAIMYYENNQSKPSLGDLKKMATVFGIEVDKLFDEYYRFLDFPCSERIKQIRAEHNLLQRELGTMLGVTRRTVEQWEHGKHVISSKTLVQLKTLNLL